MWTLSFCFLLLFSLFVIPFSPLFVDNVGFYTGFCQVMACLGRVGFFDTGVHPVLKGGMRPTFRAFLSKLLEAKKLNSTATADVERSITNEKEMASCLIVLGCCKETVTAMKTIKTIKLRIVSPQNHRSKFILLAIYYVFAWIAFYLITYLLWRFYFLLLQCFPRKLRDESLCFVMTLANRKNCI